MFEVQVEGNIIVYSDVLVRYTGREILLCTVMCVCELQSEGNVTVYIDVSLTCKMRELLLCTVMFV